jgi:pimeloyl-ACP methyl ester carboxylesterase
MNHNIVYTKEGTIEYSITGSGFPVVFLHGGHSNCNDKLPYKGFNLSKYLLITPSRPGYGQTPLSDNNTPVKAAGLIISLLDNLNIKKAIIYGISAGGITAIEIAANFPDRVEKLVLASAVSKNWLDKNGTIYKTAKRIFNPSFEHIVWGIIRIMSSIAPALLARSFHNQFTTISSPKLRKNDITELISTLSIYRSKNGFIVDINQEIDIVTISKITCPTLIIHSNNDKSVSVDHAIHAHKYIINSELELLDNEWGHIIWIGKDSDDTVQKILTFIEK